MKEISALLAGDACLCPLGTDYLPDDGPSMKRATIALVMALAGAAHAEYLATGSIQGQVCSGIVIQACSFRTVSAVKGSDGRLYEIKRSFASVTSYNDATNRCIVRIKARGDSIISWGIDAIKNPTFYEMSAGGQYEPIDVEYLSFKCVQR
jgi:hypothetical protein